MDTFISSVNEFFYPINVLKYAPVCFLVKGSVSKFRVIVLCLWYFLFLSLQVLVGMHLVNSRFAITANLTCTAAFLSSSLHTSFRQIYILIKSRQIYALADFITLFPQALELGEGAMRLNSTFKIKKYCNRILIINAISVIFAFCIIFIGPSIVSREQLVARINTTQSYYKTNQRAVYSDMWWYNDIYSNPTYYLIVAWQIIVVIGSEASTATTDALVNSILTAITERSQMLARAAPRALLPINNGVSKQFCLWVRCHQHYLNACRRVSQVLGPIFFMTTIFSIFNVITFTYLILKVDLFAAAVTLPFLGKVLVRLYTFASAGQHIIDNSDELSRSIMNGAQVLRQGLVEGPSRSSLLILAARCSGARPEEITGMSYFVVSVSLFSSVIGAAASFLLILIQFN